MDRAFIDQHDHVVPADIGEGVAAYDVQVDGVADERLEINASDAEKVVNWDVRATTDGGCRVNVTQPAAIEPPPPDRPDDGGVIFD